MQFQKAFAGALFGAVGVLQAVCYVTIGCGSVGAAAVAECSSAHPRRALAGLGHPRRRRLLRRCLGGGGRLLVVVGVALRRALLVDLRDD